MVRADATGSMRGIMRLRQGPDGLLYLLTDSSNGRLIRLLPGG